MIAVLIAASAVGTGLIFLAMRKGRERQADYAASAAEQGWAHRHEQATGHSADVNEFTAPVGKQILKAALKATLHALGKTPFTLTFDEATAGHPGGVVMASDGQARAMDGLRENAELAAFRARHKEPEVPVIIRDTTGLTLRRPGAARNLEDLRELVVLGKALVSDL